jgi:hypothetical protein
MLETISLIVGVASSLVTLIGYITDTDKHKRNNAAQLLSFIGETLEEVVEKLKVNEVPHGACEIIQQCARDIPTTLSGLLPESELQELSAKLEYAHQVEQLVITTQQYPESLIELEKAVGQFKVATQLMQIK